MSKATSQADRVLRYISEHGCITRYTAMNDIGVANLTAVIEKLRNKRGVNIITVTEKSRNRYGEKVTYAKYILGEDEDAN